MQLRFSKNQFIFYCVQFFLNSYCKRLYRDDGKRNEKKSKQKKTKLWSKNKNERGAGVVQWTRVTRAANYQVLGSTPTFMACVIRMTEPLGV